VAERIDIFVVLKQLSEFLQQTRTASKAVENVGTAADKTADKTKSSWKQLAKWGGIATAAYGAQRFLRGAVATTEDLGRSTLALSHVTGMDVKSSGEWAAMLKVRGQNTRQASMAFIKVSQSMESARQGLVKQNEQLRNYGIQMAMVRQKGGKQMPADLKKLGDQMERSRAAGLKSTATLRGLGVSMDAVRKGDTQEVILEVADAFQKMHNPAQRAALTQKLFGRTGRELLPVLMKGRKGIEDQLHMADQYGATLSTAGAKNMKEFIAKQREMKMAMLGVQVGMGQALMPVILQVVKALAGLMKIISPLTKNTTALRIAIVALTFAFVAYKIAMTAAKIAQAGFNVELFITLGWIALVVVALIAIGVAAYFVVKHWGAVKRAAEWVWNWIKDHWKLLVGILLGPFAFAVIQIATHWRQIKNGAEAAVDWVKQKFEGLISFFQNLPSRIGNWFEKIPGFGLAKKALGWGGKSASWLGKHLQAGGSVTSRTTAMVGEAGPELVSLPASATVAPLSRGQTLAFAGAGAGGQTIVTKVYLDRRQIAEAVGTYAADRVARR
jgi:biotin operon repressor